MSISREWGTVSEECTSRRRYGSLGSVNWAVSLRTDVHGTLFPKPVLLICYAENGLKRFILWEELSRDNEKEASGSFQFDMFPEESSISLYSGFTWRGTKRVASECHVTRGLYCGESIYLNLKIGVATAKTLPCEFIQFLTFLCPIFEQKSEGKGHGCHDCHQVMADVQSKKFIMARQQYMKVKDPLCLWCPGQISPKLPKIGILVAHETDWLRASFLICKNTLSVWNQLPVEWV